MLHVTCQPDLLTAFDDAAAKMPTWFWIDHGGIRLFGLQVKEEFLAALGLLPECKTAAASKTEARVLEPEITSTPQPDKCTHSLPHSTSIIVTSQSWDTSAGLHCNRYELPGQHSFHTLVYGRRTGGDKVKHRGGFKKSTNVGLWHVDDKACLQHTASLAHITIVNSKAHKNRT